MADNRRAKARKTAAQKGATRVRKHREKLRAAGLKPVQLWVWDTNAPGFAEECRRQSLFLANDPEEARILGQIEAVSDFSGWK